ncbi:MAG: sigma-70 family RNA polymerase sigma factor [Ignavibacteriales bacterium]|nr:sigma-70 family RNA polymerase sigma factor [Ignavibacteriales bacterium]
MNDELILINKVKEGDHKAFKKLYNLNVVPLYRFMRKYTNDEAQVEDWVQRAFINSYKNIGTFNGSSRYSTWLFSIALNEMRTDFRKPSIVVFDSADLHNHQVLDDEDEFFEWNDIMRSWLSELDESKRTVFVLFEVEGYSHSEIASILNINENASRTLLHRAKQLLKTKWKSLEKAV